ncbi:ABC transporter permease [Streptomyces caniscabiei]|uniref:ABC transporter permease n=1 Tax=Streptomyces caniscabiei TaxID=2746961 RepID=UPI0029B052DF|nr:ABC transporter permease [Streptomyces caniscabiei]MDX2600836.1 ABC transporter permease [Streptomyces caniscabiei]MDX2740686.1 ABC transporter permease [Streptomyces caniscabiei]MDX2779958.1 ABC transporter permease [Streptomyces caniscabiei]
MLRFIARRTLSALLILLIISAITFLLFYVAPRDPARAACGKLCTPQTLALVRHNLGIADPLPVQYWHWLVGVFAGRDFAGLGHCPAPCLGYSFTNHEPVLGLITDRFPTTLSLALGSTVVFVVFGVGTGMIAAVRQGKAADKIASSASLVGSSLQIYIVGVVAMYYLSDQWGLLPRPSDAVGLTQDSLAWFKGLLLPWLVLAIIFTANYTRMTRSQLVESLAEDYVRTARAKGMSRPTVFFRHAWRGAMGPIVTILGLDIGYLLGGAIITEETFGLHGIGALSIKAVRDNDLPLLLGVVLVAATAIVIANIVVDAVYALIDPRVRLA